MGRPAKPIAFVKGHRTSAEKEYRKAVEQKLKGDSSRLVAPDDMPDDQKKYFNFFIDELRQADILGQMDMPLLIGAARCFARLDVIENKIDSDPELILDRETSSAQDRLFKQSMRYMNELGLSPASREKLAIKKMENEDIQTIADILNSDDDEEQ